MAQTFRIGSQIGPCDPFWVQVREAVAHKAQQRNLNLIPIQVTSDPATLSPDDQTALLEELLAQELDALLCWNLPDTLIHRILDSGLPAIYLALGMSKSFSHRKSQRTPPHDRIERHGDWRAGWLCRPCVFQPHVPQRGRRNSAELSPARSIT